MSLHDEIEAIRSKLEKEQSEKLKIALFGQPGAGKSSLINKLVGSKVVEEGARTDLTVAAKVVEWNDLLLVDLPGYGTTKFPPNRFFSEFKVEDYHLFLCVFSGKFHQADTEFFAQLKSKGKVCLFVRNYHDGIWEDGKSIEELEAVITQDLRKQIQSNESVFFTSCRTGYGIPELSNGIGNHLDEAQQVKWNKDAKAYSLRHLQNKREACEKQVHLYAAASAVNGINPIPGADFSVDLGILIALFNSIRNSYGLSDERLKTLDLAAPAIGNLVNNVLKYATTEGILMLLKSFAGREFAKTAAKYVPIVGPMIAAGAAFAITRSAGLAYLEDCHKLAEALMNKTLEKRIGEAKQEART